MERGSNRMESGKAASSTLMNRVAAPSACPAAAKRKGAPKRLVALKPPSGFAVSVFQPVLAAVR